MMPVSCYLCIFLNVGLKEAAKRNVGTGANQIPDMSSFVLTGIGSDNLLVKLPNGLIIQVFRRNISNSKNIGVATVNPVTYPTPFPNTVWGAFCTKMTFAQIVTSCESVTLSGLSATTALVSGDNGSSANPDASAAVFLVIGA
ncbi:gp53-like domain-containing protein [Citrobacter cronae]|uniref:gp53-like domain-containing protein n=1 Tax=Citrobacter cronae TaxID=1748967 RepID=UPI003B983213